MEGDWIAKNPARAVKTPKVTDKPTLPFSSEEMARIVEACDRYPSNRARLKAFVLTMRYSGLRIGDVIALDTTRLRGGTLQLYTAKTGTPVCVPLPPAVLKALRAIDTNGNGVFFSTGDAKPETARANWSRYLDALFRLAGIEGGHSHRFRDTFAVELLLAGASIETVSMLLSL